MEILKDYVRNKQSVNEVISRIESKANIFFEGEQEILLTAFKLGALKYLLLSKRLGKEIKTIAPVGDYLISLGNELKKKGEN